MAASRVYPEFTAVRLIGWVWEKGEARCLRGRKGRTGVGDLEIYHIPHKVSFQALDPWVGWLVS